MRICSNCGEIYPEGVTACELDGSALSSWEETRVALGPGSDETSTTEFARRYDADDDSTIERPTVRRMDHDDAHGVALPDEMTHPGTLQARLEIDESGPVEEPTDVAEPHRRVGLTTAPSMATPPAGSPGPGRVLGNRYRLLELMSIGGFGAVFAAEDMRLAKRVAVKVLSPHLATSADHLARFRQEAVAASQLRHDGIVLVTDFDRDADGTHFIVMELLDGHDLGKRIEMEHRLAPATALGIAAQIASALDCAHRCGILHRDLKPANIFLTRRGAHDDVVKVLDFGISKVMHRRLGAENLTQTGQVVGTPYYMAPEQAQGRPDIDGRCDVYALGVLLYEMLTGAPPFLGDHYVVVALQHLTLAPSAPSASCPDLSHDIDELVLRALAKEPRDRYESMAAFHAAIQVELHALQSAPPAPDLDVSDITSFDEPSVVLGISSDETEDMATVEDWVSRRRRVSTAPYSAGQVTPPTRPTPLPRRMRSRLAAGLAAVAALGAMSTMIVGIGFCGRGIPNGAAQQPSALPEGPPDAPAVVPAAPVVPIDAGAGVITPIPAPPVPTP
jgi:eukaryotic-like serine/threonine-protein kinase